MTEPIIRVRDVSKLYRRNIYRPSLRHEATRIVQRIMGQRDAVNWETDAFTALQGINFDIDKGESVAVLGRNGAGKTTLLRLLSGVTAPTTGSISVKGRFASLIGLGAGFNYERTGRQNIYLNSAIFGVGPRQTDEIMNSIIAFSELGGFIDQPVKLYSSGMVARLGFSIAIHISPDIIFLDEILSVGDVAFQEKCERQVLEMQNNGCTIVFVSHAVSYVKKMCQRGIVLHKGEMLFDGEIDPALELYKEKSIFLPENPDEAQHAPPMVNS